jgi:hypothetical protein
MTKASREPRAPRPIPPPFVAIRELVFPRAEGGMIVYKYMTPDRMDVLENGNIRFTQPAALNDPFEALPCLTDYKQGKFEEILGRLPDALGPATEEDRKFVRDSIEKKMAEVPKELNEHFGFLSLTDERNNLLMWSHYTDAHKGFVVGFYSESPFFKPGDGKTVDGLRKVEYAKLRWFVPKGGWAGLTVAAQ